MKIVEADGFEFHFEDALDAFVFDETDNTKPTFHGAPMKGAANDVEKNLRQAGFKWLKNYLKYKFRDSYLYRHAEQKVEKPIHYICLITFDNALNSRMQKSLKQELPVGKVSRRWVQALATSCHVVNIDKWNENFPKWPVTYLATATTVSA